MNWLVLNSLFRENKNREIIPYEKISKIKTKQKFWLSKSWKFLHAKFSTFKVFENEFLLSRKWLEEFLEVLVLRESTWCTNVGGHGPLASPVSLTLDFFSEFEHISRKRFNGKLFLNNREQRYQNLRVMRLNCYVLWCTDETSETYSTPCKKSMIEIFCKIARQLLASNCFLQKI